MHGVVRAGCLLAGRYRLDSPIGRGAMGIVWRGRDELLERDVAVKEVRVSAAVTQDDADIVYQRTLREAKTAARLSHPGVATVFDVFEEDGSPWIVMELVRARALDQVVTEDGPLRPLAAARVGECLLSALTSAHAAGVLHRDVKPSNVLLGEDGRAVLTDFGIATFEGDPGLTQVGMVVGTPGFTAPERLRGQSATPAADLWSLGATLYAAVEGRGPYERAGGPAAVMAAIVNEKAPRAPSAGPLMPVIDALLRRDPAARPDAAAAARLLAGAAAGAQAGGTLPSYPWPYIGAVDGADPGRDATTAACPIPPGPLMPDGIPAFLTANAPPGADDPGDPGGLADPPDLGRLSLDLGRLSADLADPPGPGGPPGPAELPAFLDMPAFAGEPAFPDGSRFPDEPPFTSLPSFSGVTESGGQPASWPSPPPQPPSSPVPARPLPPPRQGRALAIALAATAVLAAGLFGGLAYARSFGGQPTAPGAAGQPQQAGSKASDQARTSAGAQAAPGAGPSTGTASPDTAGTGTTGTGTAGTAPGGTATAGAGGTGPASASPGPAASEPAIPAAPAGYHWYTVPAASSGATAGFTIAVPDGWLPSRHGLITYLTSPSGSMRAEINLTPFVFASPVREARRQSRQAIRQGQYPGYRGGIVPGTFHGAADAVWRFSWRQGAGRISVIDLLVRLTTGGSQQPYALNMSAPRPDAAAARAIFEQMLPTFRPA
jgi:serine/threonine protein kinase